MIALVLHADSDLMTRDERLDVTDPENRYNPDMALIGRLVSEGKFKSVAMLNCTDLNDVFRSTNHIDAPWPEVAEVQGKLMNLQQERVRSTSIGDIIVTDGKAFVVSAVGFAEAPEAIAKAATDLFNITEDKRVTAAIKGDKSIPARVRAAVAWGVIQK